MGNIRQIPIWKATFKDGKTITIEDASRKEAYQILSHDDCDKYGILMTLELIHPKPQGIVVTYIELDYGITLFSKTKDLSFPLFRMISRKFTEIDISDEVFKNDRLTYRDLILEKYKIKEDKLYELHRKRNTSIR